MTISPDMAALVGFGCEAFLYGIYTVLFAVSVYLMRKRSRRPSGINKPIFGISVLLYLTCATHFIIEFHHYYTTLVTIGVNGFGNETSQLMGADFLVSVADFLGEIILIYRCWLMWSRNYWIILLPSLIAGVTLVFPSEVVHLLSEINPSSPLPPQALVPMGLAAFVLPLCTNVVLTTLIAGRIWYLSPRDARNLRGGHFPGGTGRAAINIVVESGMLYLVVQLIFVVLFAIGHPALDIIAVVAIQTYGIAATLIIIRVALGLSTTPSASSQSGAGSMPHPMSTQVRVGYATTAFSDAGQPFAASAPPTPPHTKTKVSEMGSSFIYMEPIAAV